MKEVIAVDIDDVLSHTAKGFTDFSNQRHGTSLTVSDFSEDWAKMWGVDMEEVERRAADYTASGAASHFEHHEVAKPVLRHLKSSFNLIAITSRNSGLKAITQEWVHRHFVGVFEDIQFAGIYDGPLHDGMLAKTKGELFARNNVSYVIDDHPKHCFAAAKLGIQAVLFGNYQWNQTGQLPDNITRCGDWPAVQEYFDGRG